MRAVSRSRGLGCLHVFGISCLAPCYRRLRASGLADALFQLGSRWDRLATGVFFETGHRSAASGPVRRVYREHGLTVQAARRADRAPKRLRKISIELKELSKKTLRDLASRQIHAV